MSDIVVKMSMTLNNGVFSASAFKPLYEEDQTNNLVSDTVMQLVNASWSTLDFGAISTAGERGWCYLENLSSSEQIEVRQSGADPSIRLMPGAPAMFPLADDANLEARAGSAGNGTASLRVVCFGY